MVSRGNLPAGFSTSQRKARSRRRFSEVRYEDVAMENRGFCRSEYCTRFLRECGVPIEMSRVITVEKARGQTIRCVPWAPKFIVDFFLSIRFLEVSKKDKARAVREVWELKKPGPLAEAILVAKKMMSS